MIAQHCRAIRYSAWIAAVSIACLANSVMAGPIPAGSVTGGPPVIGSVAPGTVVETSNLITNQYQSVGLDGSFFLNLSGTALGTLGNTAAYVPTVNTAGGYTLDYNGFVGFQVVNPTTGAVTTTNRVSVEFLGATGVEGQLYGMTAAGAIIGTAMTGDVIGPNGGRMITLDMAGVALFSVWGIFDQAVPEGNRPFWGLASIEINPDPGGVSETPEPASLAIAGIGIISVAGATWRRRRLAVA
jgi:hypothetical protein